MPLWYPRADLPDQSTASDEPCRETIILISTNAGLQMGGEAIKAFQYFQWLLDHGYDAHLLTHSRCRDELLGILPRERLHFVEDDSVQKWSWRLPPTRFLLNPYFHVTAARYVSRRFPRSDDVILHYIGPVSPVVPRFPPNGYRVVMGPLTGNIYYPPAFADRQGRLRRTQEVLHGVTQRTLGSMLGDKRQAEVILVSGYARTRASLRLAGCEDHRMIDVVDAGVSERIAARPRVEHRGVNGRFLCSGRMVDHKGIDLAVRAIARTEPPITLDVFGDGPCRPAWESLASDLGVSDRVRFHGWLESHDDLMDRMREFRGYVFPTLAEANGIVMQEAMMCGLPVITIRWGGPEQLASDDAAVYIAPNAPEEVVNGIARAMSRLASDPDFAEGISVRARSTAENRFTWDQVARSWVRAYQRP